MGLRFFASWTLVLASGLAIAACSNSPGALCQTTADKEQALFDRCADTWGIQFVFRLRLGDEDRECGMVSHVSNPDNIVYNCWPYLDNVACEDVTVSSPESGPELDASCDFGQFDGL